MISKNSKYNRGIPDLLDATKEELMELFKSLPAPTMEEMHGEFYARMVGKRTFRELLTWQFEMQNNLTNGTWIGKAFRQVDEKTGRGYNIFRRANDKIVHNYPMKTMIAPSRYDGKPAFTLIYRAFHSKYGFVHMVDEVRKLGAGQYLLIGTYGLTKKSRMIPDFNILEGPRRPYEGDVGQEKPFELEAELPNYHLINTVR